MKSLARRFNNIRKRNPLWGSYVCLTEAVKGRDFKKQTISRWFQKLADKSEYIKNEKRALLAHLEALAKTLEDNKN